MTTLTPQQAAAVLHAHRLAVRRRRTKRWEWLLHARLARRQGRRQFWIPAAERADRRAAERREVLAATPVVARPYPPVSAALFTGLLMFASYFTVAAILATADLAPLEAWLLPLAFGPVFVLATKTAVAGWLSSGPTDRRPGPTPQALRLVVAPALAIAALGLVVGIAIKSVAVGSPFPLSPGAGELSSVLMFGGLALGELAGAAALAARQHRPGARAYARASRQARWATWWCEFAHRRRHLADGRVAAAERAVEVRESWKAGRAELRVATGWWRAARHSAVGDPVLERIPIEPVRTGSMTKASP